MSRRRSKVSGLPEIPVEGEKLIPMKSSKSPKSRSSQPRGRQSLSSPTTVGNETWTDRLHLTGPTLNTPHLYKGFSGREYGTEYYDDRVDTTSLQVIIRSFDVAMELQSGSLADDTITSLKQLTDTMFNLTVRELLARKEISIRDTTIVTPGNFDAYLSVYGTTFAALYTLESLLVSSGLNDYMLHCANAVAANVARLEAAVRWLMSLSIPPMFLDIVAMYFGVHAPSDQAPIIIAAGMGGPAINPTDLSLSASITAILSQCETNISTLFAAGDNMIIGNVLRLLYGKPRWPQIRVHTDRTTWWTLLGSAVNFHDSGAGKTFSAQSVKFNANIPILIPSQDARSRATELNFSLMRPSPYTTDNVAGVAGANIPNAAGLIMPTEFQTNGRGTTVVLVEPNMAVNVSQELAGASPYDLNTLAGANCYSWWAPYAVGELGSYATQGDYRSREDVDIVYVSQAQLTDETAYIIEKMFAEGRSL